VEQCRDRAQVIARTETKYAQNVSTIERARAGGVDRFTVFDGRLGPGRSDLYCMARNKIRSSPPTRRRRWPRPSIRTGRSRSHPISGSEDQCT
jgi:hypothetical protein